jgi:hypothetical protein
MPQTATENHVTERASAPSGTADVIAKTVSITKALFPGDVRVEAEEDPEIAGLSYVVFNVAAAGGPREIIERRLEWHRRIAELGADAGRLKLSVDVRR